MGQFRDDKGSVLRPDETALVVSADGDLSIRLPLPSNKKPLPDMARLLVAVLIKSQDEVWVEDMLAGLE